MNTEGIGVGEGGGKGGGGRRRSKRSWTYTSERKIGEEGEKEEEEEEMQREERWGTKRGKLRKSRSIRRSRKIKLEITKIASRPKRKVSVKDKGKMGRNSRAQNTLPMVSRDMMRVLNECGEREQICK